jgi:hypothetical protein
MRFPKKRPANPAGIVDKMIHQDSLLSGVWTREVKLYNQAIDNFFISARI